jgi:hypothetical protein
VFCKGKPFEKVVTADALQRFDRLDTAWMTGK